MRKVIRIGSKSKSKSIMQQKGFIASINTRIEMIQALIPIGLMAVAEQLEEEVVSLAGARYSRHGGLPGHYPMGKSTHIHLSDQKICIGAIRVRNSLKNEEVPLQTCQALKSPRQADEGLLRRILLGLSCRSGESCVEAIPEAFGLSPSTVSRCFKQASSRKLKEMVERDLSPYDFVALFIDGKSFADDEMIIALGVTLTGEKIPLGFIQAATENERVLKSFLSGLLARGLNIEEGILCIIDGVKGLHSAIHNVFMTNALIQRCQWHKRENVMSYLPKSHQSIWRRRL